jgi:manganese/zinc/iron transport system permease protein
MTSLSSDELWMFATCAVCAAACAIPGVFLTLRRESLMGDAISHSVLPGLATAFLLSGSRDLTTMLAGALVAGLMSVGISLLIQHTRRAHADAAIGMVYTSFFALGVLLLSLGARNVDIDPGCVLYGLVEFAPLDTVQLGMFGGGIEVPRSFLILSSVLLTNLALACLFYKELLVSTFDPILARSLGFSSRAIHYGLMTVATITIVASFESVGSILVITMLIAPAATANLLANRVASILVLAAIVGVISAYGGIVGATALNTSVAGMMSVSAGGLFFSALLFAPHNGVIARSLQRIYLRVQIAQEDILGLLYRWYEAQPHAPTERPMTAPNILNALHRGWVARVALVLAHFRGYITREGGSLQLTEHGLVEAKALVRSHRLWESYLAKHLGLPADHLHDPSERAEHYIGRALSRELEKELLSSKDPHGKRIP